MLGVCLNLLGVGLNPLGVGLNYWELAGSSVPKMGVLHVVVGLNELLFRGMGQIHQEPFEDNTHLAKLHRELTLLKGPGASIMGTVGLQGIIMSFYTGNHVTWLGPSTPN